MRSTWRLPRRRSRRRWYAGRLRYLATLAAVANLVLIAAILLKLRDLVMRHHLLVAAAAAASLLLSGCLSLPSEDRAKALQYGLEHIEGCDRTYTGGTGVGAAFTFNIVCKAQPPAGPAAKTPAAGQEPPL